MDALIESHGRTSRQHTMLYGEPLAERITNSHEALPLTVNHNEPVKSYKVAT
jgi:hypothetical protein